jgi:DNA-binding NtrC family response regulator
MPSLFPPPVAKRIVLVVDDEPQVVKTVARTLLRHGYEVIGASSAAEGLMRAAQLRPDLIISDYRMPSSNGAAMLRDVLKRQPNIACVLMSGGGDFADEEIPPAVVYLSKPWSAAELVMAAQCALGRALAVATS